MLSVYSPKTVCVFVSFVPISINQQMLFFRGENIENPSSLSLFNSRFNAFHRYEKRSEKWKSLNVVKKHIFSCLDNKNKKKPREKLSGVSQ